MDGLWTCVIADMAARGTGPMKFRLPRKSVGRGGSHRRPAGDCALPAPARPRHARALREVTIVLPSEVHAIDVCAAYPDVLGYM